MTGPIHPSLQTFADYKRLMQATLHEIEQAVPTLQSNYYLGGTTPVACVDLEHDVSLDLDLHTKKELAPTSAEATKLKRTLGSKLRWYSVDAEFGLYRGNIKTTYEGRPVVLGLDVMSNIDTARPGDTKRAPGFCQMDVISLRKYLATKIQCLDERQETKDLYHLFRLSQAPQTREMTRQAIERADPLIIVAAVKSALADWPQFKSKLLFLPGMVPFKEAEFLSWLEALDPEKSKERDKNDLGRMRSNLRSYDKDPPSNKGPSL
jgi:hypothetical protein